MEKAAESENARCQLGKRTSFRNARVQKKIGGCFFPWKRGNLEKPKGNLACQEITRALVVITELSLTNRPLPR